LIQKRGLNAQDRFKKSVTVILLLRLDGMPQSFFNSIEPSPTLTGCVSPANFFSDVK